MLSRSSGAVRVRGRVASVERAQAGIRPIAVSADAHCMGAALAITSSTQRGKRRWSSLSVRSGTR